MTENKQDIKRKVQSQFGDNAQNYVTSGVHAASRELQLMVEMANPQPGHHVLDIATGGGHTALAFARYAGRVVATDITQKILDAAKTFITPQVDNVTFRLADAEELPFEDGTFDIVTCRVAPHHFSDLYQFVLESARVLKPGGLLIIQDHDAPDDERDAAYVDAFEKLRDPSHVKAYNEREWRGTFLDAQLEVEAVRTGLIQPDNFLDWTQRMNVPTADVQRLEVMLAQAPAQAKAWLEPKGIGTPEGTIVHRYIIIAGRKPPAGP
jgi:ubiquinone/menaquinone biosynthesis C-methylase UbiE